ncbi:MAG: hydrogenase maturation protease [Acidobacteriia bacterium]|nr:hydrogenase maturation protease [Terriglobia bacterium]
MARILILGYGNPLRSDDGLGWRAAEELSRTLSSADVDILARHQLTPELAGPLSQAATVFFIDASREGEPGELSCVPVTPQASGAGFSHQLSPAAVLALSQLLFGTSPRAFLVSLCGQNFDHGENLSPPVAAGLPRLTALVGQLVQHLGQQQAVRSR